MQDRQGAPRGNGGWLLALRLKDLLGRGFVAHDLYVVAIGPNDKCSAVVGVVLRPHTGRAVVMATRFECQTIEVLNLLSRLGCERQVEGRVGCLFGCTPNAKRGNAVRAAELDTKWSVGHDLDVERCESTEKERSALGVVADAQYNVVKHGGLGLVLVPVAAYRVQETSSS